MLALRLPRPSGGFATTWSRPASASNPHAYVALFYEYAAKDMAELAEKRAPLRPAHLAHAGRAKDEGRLALGGAWGDAGPMGGLLIFKGASVSEVEAFAAGDPYVTGGLVKAWGARPWNVVVDGLSTSSSSSSSGAGTPPVEVDVAVGPGGGGGSEGGRGGSTTR